jgi:hypothetical protein
MLEKLRLGEFRDKILNNPSRKWIEFWISRLLAKGDTLAHANIIREDDKTWGEGDRGLSESRKAISRRRDRAPGNASLLS